jgi:NAD(P)H-nitrite reductase large subunit
MNVTSIGKVVLERGEEGRFQVIDKTDDMARRYEKYVLSEGCLVGCILLGSRDNYGFATQHIGKPLTAAEVRIRLW